MGRFTLVFLILLGILFLASPLRAEERRWAFSLFHATLAQERLVDVFLRDHFFEDSYLVGMRLSREFAGSRRSLSWEAEGQLVNHYGKQSHWETNAVVVARWNRFPWDRFVDTTIAAGEGISLASRIPRVEAEDHENTSQLLNYLLFEATAALPHYPRWRLFGIIHHRSGVFGLFNNVRGGSNFTGGGIAYLF